MLSHNERCALLKKASILPESSALKNSPGMEEHITNEKLLVLGKRC